MPIPTRKWPPRPVRKVGCPAPVPAPPAAVRPLPEPELDWDRLLAFDPEPAPEPELEVDRLAVARYDFLNCGWRRSKRGNLTRTIDGSRVTIFGDDEDGYRFCIDLGGYEPTFSTLSYETEDDALLAAWETYSRIGG
jgi:hypothetical protein